MTPPFPIDCYRAAMDQIAQSVFETMLGIRTTAVDGSSHERAAEYTAAVYYAGAWKGALLIECSAEQAMDWSARLMSLDPPLSLEDARDGLGELTNIVAGNLKPILPPGAGLSIPSVVRGSDYNIRLCGGNLVEHIERADANGPFRVTLVEVTS